MSQGSSSMKFDFPTSWRHGRGLASRSGEVLRDLGCKNTLLLTDRLLVNLGVVQPVSTSLEKSNIDYLLCDEVTREPTVSFVQELAEKLDLKDVDSILAVGGGSVIDVAKALAVIAQFGGHIRDYGGMNKIPEPLTRKIITVPTTAGTGSEISEGSALIDEKIQSKFLVLSTLLCPAVAITDPEMTTSMPPNITANSGVDALTHAIESYLSKDASVASEIFSIKAVGLIGKGLKRAYDSGDDIQARETVQIGATMAMIAGMNAHMGLCHAMIMPLCALYNIPHGKACGMVIPHVLAYNEDVEKEKVAEIFNALGFFDNKTEKSETSKEFYDKLTGLIQGVGIEARLSHFGYREEHMDTIVQETFNSIQCQFNPRSPTEEDIIGIVKEII